MGCNNLVMNLRVWSGSSEAAAVSEGMGSLSTSSIIYSLYSSSFSSSKKSLNSCVPMCGVCLSTGQQSNYGSGCTIYSPLQHHALVPPSLLKKKKITHTQKRSCARISLVSPVSASFTFTYTISTYLFTSFISAYCS